MKDLLRRNSVTFALFALAIITLSAACSSDDSTPSPTPEASNGSETPSATGTPAPPDPVAAQRAFERFVAAIRADEIQDAWVAYIASGQEDGQPDNGLGCKFEGFAAEFPRFQNLFERISPIELVESFGNAGDNLFIELRVRGADDNEYLARLLREPAHADYRVQSFNSGVPSSEPGVPDPFPSPEDPQGFCAVWTGPR